MKPPKEPPKKAPASKLVVWVTQLFGKPARYVTVPILVTAVLSAGCYYLWQKVRDQVIAAPEYQVTRNSIELTDVPPWIHSNISDEVLNQMSMNGPLSLLDDQLAERLAEGFSLHPWIRRVVRVEKRFPARVIVLVEYRQPVCMVEVPTTGGDLADTEDAGFAPGDPRSARVGGLYPVDGEGVLLPSADFSPAQARRYPRLSEIHSLPIGPVGANWGDPRVTGAAEVAAIIREDWEKLQLHRMIASEQPQAGGSSEDYEFTIIARDGTRIVWGQRPSSHLGGEVAATEKLERLRQHVSHGPPDPNRAALEIDIRDPKGVSTGARVARKAAPSPAK